MSRRLGLALSVLTLLSVTPAEGKDCRQDLQKEAIVVEVGKNQRCWGVLDEWCRSEWSDATGGRKHLLIFKNVSNRPQALAVYDWPFLEPSEKWPAFAGGDLITIAPATSDTFRIRPGARKGIHYVHNIGCNGALDSLQAYQSGKMKAQEIGPGVIVE